MSQKREKTIRQINKRVTNLEGRVDKLDDDVIMQAVKIAQMDDELAVYRAAVGARDAKRAETQVAEARAKRAEKRQREAAKRRRLGISVLAVLIVAMALVVAARATVNNRQKDEATEKIPQVEIATVPTAAPTCEALASMIIKEPEPPKMTAPAEGEPAEAEDPMETEKIEAALLKQGYYSEAVPMCYEWQDFMRTYCAAYSCPYSLALAVAETETHFDMDAVGAAGEVGIMQLSPGPGGAYHEALQEITRLDPTTPCGNIAAGCYLLGKYLQDYGDIEKAAMAYNMGVGGAVQTWKNGITSTEYSRKVLAAAERWECTVIEWQGM